jgi:putative component of membrane protein insertase Oxa1/YidC/SpoIIIJ protein YidD
MHPQIRTIMAVTVSMLLYLAGYSQPKSNSVQPSIEHVVFSEYKVPKKEKRPFLLVAPKKKIGYYNPLLYVAGGLLFVYQNIFSVQISASCTYETSCSEYTKKAIQKYGLLKGTFIGLHQLSTCTPSIHKDYCDHLHAESGKIINTID